MVLPKKKETFNMVLFLGLSTQITGSVVDSSVVVWIREFLIDLSQ